MADLPVSDVKVPVMGYLSPGMDDRNEWATHKAQYGQGGFETVQTIAARNAITPDRIHDKVVFVRDNETFYIENQGSWDEIPLETLIAKDGSGVNRVEKVKILEFVGATVTSGVDNGKAIITIPAASTATLDPTRNVLHFQTIAERNQWSASEGSKYTKVVCVVDQDVSGEVAWFQWASNTWSDYEISGPASASGTLHISDSVLDIGSANQLEFLQGKLLEDGAGGVQYTPYVDCANQGGGYEVYSVKQINAVHPLKFESASSGPGQITQDEAMLSIDHAAFEPLRAPAFLGYLSEGEAIVGRPNDAKEHRAALWFDDVIYPGAPFIATDRNRKAYGIQEADYLDPNVSGGTNYLVAFRAHMKGKAPADGFVRIGLQYLQTGAFTPTGYVLDTNGNPMVVERHYKAGTPLGTLDVMGIVNAKAEAEFTCFAMHNFPDEEIYLTDRTEGPSGLLIQALTQRGKTTPALLQFEADTQQNIEFSTHYMGPSQLDIGYVINTSGPVVSYIASKDLSEPDGFYGANRSGFKFGSENGQLVITDDGQHLIDYEFGKVFSAEVTQMLRGKVINILTTSTTKLGASRVVVASWKGKPDEFTSHVFAGWSNENPTYAPGWSEVGNYQISEDIINVDVVNSKDFTIPADANNFAILVTSATGPISTYELKLREFKMDVKEPFYGYVLRAPEILGENYLVNSQNFKQLIQDTQGYVSLRYTINNPADGNPMPVGVLGRGAADITLDPKVNVVAGSGARGGEGAIVFGADGRAKIYTKLYLWNEQVSATDVTFWWSTVDPVSGLLTKLPDSAQTFQVPAGAKGVMFDMTYSLDVTDGMKLALRAKSDSVDGAFLQAIPSKPMLYNSIDFTELVASSHDEVSPNLNLDQFDSVYPSGLVVSKKVINVASTTIPVGASSDAQVIVLGVTKKMEDGTLQPVTGYKWSYSNKTSVLDVTFGETITEGYITMGVYSQ